MTIVIRPGESLAYHVVDLHLDLLLKRWDRIQHLHVPYWLFDQQKRCDERYMSRLFAQGGASGLWGSRRLSIPHRFARNATCKGCFPGTNIHHMLIACTVVSLTWPNIWDIYSLNDAEFPCIESLSWVQSKLTTTLHMARSDPLHLQGLPPTAPYPLPDS